MKIRDVMTADPACCTRKTRIPQAADLMVAHDCGALPVIDDEASRRPVGFVTDRDIVTRLVALGADIRESRVAEAMTDATITVGVDEEVAEGRRRMQENQLRRLVVVGDEGRCVGVVSLADVAASSTGGQVVEVLREVSRPRTGPERTSLTTPQG